MPGWLLRRGVLSAAIGWPVPRDSISVAEVVAAIDGDIGLTQCSVHVAECTRTDYCPTRPHWTAINRAVERGPGGGVARRDADAGSLCAASPGRRRPSRCELKAKNNRMTASIDTLDTVRALSQEGYKYGFVTDIEVDEAPPGLTEETIRFISAKKDEPEWLLEWRLAAFRAWQKMTPPNWAKLNLAPIDYQAATYYSAPKQNAGPKSLDEVDPELLRTYEKLGIPLREREALAGVAVDAVFDSISVATTFKEQLGKLGIIFCSFGEAVREHPELVRKYLGTVVPQNDNFFAALNSAVFSDGSFAYVPPGVRCPMELSTYFRINAAKTGQFERTLLIADKGSYVSYLEGCTAPQRDENQLHAAVVELIAHEDAQIKYSTVQNWYPGDAEGKGGIYNFVTKARRLPRRSRQDLVDAGRDRLRDHLEIPELHSRR